MMDGARQSFKHPRQTHSYTDLNGATWRFNMHINLCQTILKTFSPDHNSMKVNSCLVFIRCYAMCGSPWRIHIC